MNCDMGEGFGAYALGPDEALMPLITSANVACGFHAGDPRVMQRTIQLAVQHGVAVGAHPGFHDLVGFGRRMMDATPDEIEADVLYQIGALDAFVRAAGVKTAHVKAHGALYNLAADRLDIARSIARAVARYDSTLFMVGLAGSAMIEAAREVGLRAAPEGFCDRTYTPEGRLLSRRVKGSLIDDPQRAAEQALSIALQHKVTAADGQTIPLVAETLCIHSDTPAALAIARAVRDLLVKNGVTVAPLGK